MKENAIQPRQVELHTHIIKTRIAYPTWKILIKDYVTEARNKNPEVFNTQIASMKEIFSRLDMVKKVTVDRDPRQLVTFLHSSSASYTPKATLAEVKESFKRVSVRQNEFYAIFDFKSFSYTEVDERIQSILGIAPSDFNVVAMAGFDPENPLYHLRDYNHLLRWNALTYYMLTINLFKWNSLEDQYRVRFRVGTAKSTIQHYKDEGHATLEKLCFLFCDKIENENSKPIYHFDKWLVFNKTEFEGLKPRWLSSPEREIHLNTFSYLVHAYLLELSIPHLLFLHFRQYHDRNKAIASAINDLVLKHSGVDPCVEEHQVADCFAKTLRGKMAQLMNIWDKRIETDLELVQSDIQAVEVAKTLGLLPIPEKVLIQICRGVVEE